MKIGNIFCLIVMISILPASIPYAHDVSSNEFYSFPSLISSLRLDPSIEFCGRKVPIENPEVRERFEKELVLTLWNRSQIILWLKRSRRYLPYIEKILKESGLPEDIKYISVAESALLPHIRSRKGAVGLWQFMDGTGRKYGLKINRSIDERRSIFASTAAAVRYFKDLYEMFESWELAAAAYNMGEDRLMAEMLEQNINNYYQLYLPLETQRYIFRTLSIKLILQQPEKYGFKLTDDDYYAPFAFDSVEVNCRQAIPIRIVAQSANTYFKAIKDLNPHILGHYLSKGINKILIPEGASKGFQNRYARFEDAYISGREERAYIVRRGDNLTAIAEKFNVPLRALTYWNQIDLIDPIYPGQRLSVYPE